MKFLNENNQKIKILLLAIEAGQSLGGSEIFIERFFLLLRKDLDIEFLVANQTIYQRLQKHNAKTRMLKTNFRSFIPLWYINIFIQLCSISIKFRPHIVILNGQGESYFTIVLRLLRFKTIIIRHFDLLILNKSKLKKKIFYFLSRHSNAVIALTKTTALQLKDNLCQKKICVIKNWVDTEKSIIINPKPNPIFRILFIGRTNKEKGIFDLIEAIRGLCDIHLTVVGDGKDFLILKDKCKDLQNVSLLGFQRQVNDYYTSNQLCILPSYYEACPLVILEAMAHGIPCLLSDIPSLLEMGNYGECAFFFKVGDHLDLRNKIVQIKNNPALVSKIKNNAYIKLQRDHSADTARESYLKLINNLIKNSSSYKSKKI